MALTRYKIGKLVSDVDERNSYGIRKFCGINIQKDFIPTVADTSNLDASKYKVVRKNRFVFSGMQTGRDACIRISMYAKEFPIIVSPAYTTFEISARDVVLPEYFFMLFLSQEKDRLGWFYSDSSVRANLEWDTFCDVPIDLPPLSVQQKYVNIYNAMLANQRSYERGLEDLKLSIDAVIEQFKHTASRVSVGELLEEVDNRNTDREYTSANGINITKQFMPSVASSSDLNRYKIVRKNQFAYSAMQTGRDKCIRIALLQDDTPIIVSPAYSILQKKTDIVIEDFIQMWFSRAESDRLGWFMSDASIRANLDLPRFYEIEIPLPDMEQQKSLVDIYRAYVLRRNINDKLKAQIKSVCPILIKGSLEERSV